MLTSEDAAEVARMETYGAEVAHRASRKGGVLGEDLRREFAVRATDVDREVVLGTMEPTIAERFEAVDIDKLRQASHDLVNAMLLDLNDSPTQGAPRRARLD